MATKNRSEVSIAIQAQAATVGETEYKDNLDTEMIQNLVFRKDVSDADTANAATKTIDFLDIDYFEITQNAATVAYTLNNIQQGEIKYLKITKTANQAITFAVGTDVSQRQSFITTQTVVIYRVVNKDGSLYIESININNDLSSDLYSIIVDIGDWDMDASDTVTVVHGIAAATALKIRSTDVIIRDDTDAVRVPLNAVTAAGLAGGVDSQGTVSTILRRIASGKFDNTSYDSTSFNRGWILYWIEP